MKTSLYADKTPGLFAEIAVAVDRAVAARLQSGAPGRTTARPLARGDGWTVHDVLCTCDGRDRPYEERNERVAIAIVIAGSFEYRCATGHTLLTPGSLLLGNAGHTFECSHDHGAGDRCISFQFEREWFARLASDVGAGVEWRGFRVPRLPALKPLSPVAVRSIAALDGRTSLGWEELALGVAAQSIRLAEGLGSHSETLPAGAAGRMTPVLRFIERAAEADLSLTRLAAGARLSPYHFLRTFERTTGLTPHQYIRRTRLRAAATRLVTTASPVIDVAFDAGFGDVSNFNRSFRDEFGMNPRKYRAVYSLSC